VVWVRRAGGAPPRVITEISSLPGRSVWKAIGDGKSTKATVADAELLFPSTVAVIVVVPATRPVTIPVADTVAMLWSPLDQVTGRPKSAAPPASPTPPPKRGGAPPPTPPPAAPHPPSPPPHTRHPRHPPRPASRPSTHTT